MPHKQDDTTQQLSLLWFSRNEIIKNKNIKKKKLSIMWAETSFIFQKTR